MTAATETVKYTVTVATAIDSAIEDGDWLEA
jgi:hypothetical protein